MSRSDVKVQINSLVALERLIGGDTEMEIEIRKSVATAFAKKYLNTVVVANMAKIVEDVRKFVTEKINDELGTFKRGWDGRIEGLTLNLELKEAIKQEAKKQMEQQVEAWMRVASNEQMEKLERMSKTSCNIIIRELDIEIRKQVKEEVSALVSKLVKEG
jgi:hypothetical protein